MPQTRPCDRAERAQSAVAPQKIWGGGLFARVAGRSARANCRWLCCLATTHRGSPTWPWGVSWERISASRAAALVTALVLRDGVPTSASPMAASARSVLTLMGETFDADRQIVDSSFFEIYANNDARVRLDNPHSLVLFSLWVSMVGASNCGFSLTPTRPDQRELVARTLESVGDMDVRIRRHGVSLDNEQRARPGRLVAPVARS
jgi:hypothetical protein